MDKHRAAELLDKYKAGTCSEQEKLLVEAWYVWEAEQNSVVPEVIPFQTKARIWQKIGQGTHIPPERKLKTGYFLKVAASVLIVAAVSYYGFTVTKSKQIPESIHFATLATGNGEVRKFQLPDGSAVTLNAGSRVRYDSSFIKREVFLDEGEVFFDVKHDTSRSFEVKAGATTTKVLGTAFGVRAYRSMKNIRVTVARGKVSVTTANDWEKNANPAYLLPNDQLTFDKNTGVAKQTTIDAESYLTWLGGALRFDNEELAEIGVILEKKFGNPIFFSDKALGEKHLTASFGADDSLEYILEGICLAEGLTFKKQVNRIVISKREGF